MEQLEGDLHLLSGTAGRDGDVIAALFQRAEEGKDVSGGRKRNFTGEEAGFSRAVGHVMQEGNEGVVSEVPGLKGFGMDLPEIGAKVGPREIAIDRLRHGTLDCTENVFALKAFGDGTLPAIEYVFCFRHG